MKSKSIINKILLTAVAVLLVAAITAAVIFLPGFISKDVKNYNYISDTTPVSFDRENYDISLGDGSFLFNSRNSSFAIASADNKAVFNSLSEEAANEGNATILSLRLRDKKGNAYFLDTSSNSVPFKSFKITDESENSFTLSYSLFPDEGSAKAGTGNADIYACVNVKFSVKNSVLNVCVNTEEIQLPENFFIEKLSVLPGLYSVSSFENAVFTVPDGCGAEIDTASVTENTISLNLDVYGSDTAVYEYAKGALLPFFAVNKNGYLLNAVIEEGDAISEITCKKQKNGGGYLYNTFTVTPCVIRDGVFIRGASYSGNVSQSYALSKGEGYNGVAAQVRDSLLKKGYINSSLVTNYTDLPFFINVVGSADGENKLTAFESAAEITALLKSRGVRSINLRYSGYDEKGLFSDSGSFTSPAASLGGEDGFEKLSEKINEQGNTLTVDVNVLTSQSKNGEVSLYEQTARFVGSTIPEFTQNPVSSVNNAVSKAYKFAVDFPSTGVCLNDGAQLLYSDINEKINRQQALSYMQNSVGAFSAVGGFMLSEPAVYLMKQASSVFSTPTTASIENEKGVTVVPILQMVIHGSVVYGANLINATNLSPDDAFLKCVEYGGVPSFLFTNDSTTAVSYSSYATQTSKLYSRAKKLSPVMNMKMTSHEKVTDGVYKITYDYSKIVYVNYNPAVVEVNGVMISAKDFIVI